ncbi:MAG: LON peptidase substrate-binding domain-containing protein [Gammaproteobacteria bacterium]|nr:LON peptidase substrate-binding domain-containing protein [Gammaproteobacteria bacterium]MCW8988297.1 LON peptidase substrate-binding domain-containing protein [Gammaproteobacteria bacterium]MCW9032285.1 LON peptidase substrate-binding domain-containing protein [Gammaproteobacteria bacterium]
MEVIEKIKIPLFPLNAVLFPGGALPLRIFEPRYLDMVSDCMKNDSRIGVVLIENGHEAGSAAKAHEVGTISFISYWHKRNDGMLGITLTGEQRFRVISTEVKANQLIIAEVELLPNIEASNNEHNAEQLINLLKQIIAQLEPPYTTMEKFYEDLDWVSARLIELLPLPLIEKQTMLMMSNVTQRINHLQPLLVAMEML